jgi:quercetin dioxygenase-like cupin family protein
MGNKKLLHCRMAALAFVAGLATQAPVLADEAAFIRTVDSAEIAWGPCPEFMPEGCALAVLQGNPAERNADVFFKLPAKSTAALHTHTSAERMVLVSGEMKVQYEGQEPVVLKAGTYAYGPASLPHEATCSSDQDCILFIAFEEPVDAIAAGE